MRLHKFLALSLALLLSHCCQSNEREQSKANSYINAQQRYNSRSLIWLTRGQGLSF